VCEEISSRAFQNRVVRKIFASKRDEAAGGWTELHIEEVHNLYCPPNIINVIK
jgi:hypothetical protein